jgi:hypothetical protein
MGPYIAPRNQLPFVAPEPVDRALNWRLG